MPKSRGRLLSKKSSVKQERNEISFRSIKGRDEIMKNALCGALATALLFTAMLWMNPRKTVNADQAAGSVGRYRLQPFAQGSMGTTLTLVDTATGRVWFLNSLIDPHNPTLIATAFGRLYVDALPVDPGDIPEGVTVCKTNTTVSH